MFKTTELCMDVKTYLQNDKRTKLGKDYQGALTRITDGLFTFVEGVPRRQKRNPHVFNGKLITITRRDDGTLCPNFKPMKVGAGFTVDGYALEVANELRTGLKGLIGK